WGLLIASLGFGVYKNFTAIDRHTVHEREIVDKQLMDTNKIENFVRSFASTYHSWEKGEGNLTSRQEHLKQYLSTELQDLNRDDIGSDVQTSASVSDITIWDIEEVKGEYRVTYQVSQDVMKTRTKTVEKKVKKKVVKETKEVEEKKNVTSAYHVMVHVDAKGNMVIVKNPTMASIPKKSSYEPKAQEENGSVNSDDRDSVMKFLNTFFKLYPTANAQELSFYVKDGVLSEIGKDYEFNEIVNAVLKQDGKNIKVDTTVRYINKETNQNMLQQFDVTLKNIDGNWKIIK
ncbi:MAG: conjugal transfer protein, partial [Lachnospiraceae bacterium]|nr:conjugal transfer protein [Lachnospiraceae bacterium]